MAQTPPGIYWRVERLSADACSCYDGTAALDFYLSDAKVPSELQLEVMTLIAETAFSITTDLERIKAELSSSKRKQGQNRQTLSVVQQLSEIITALGTGLSNQIADAAAERRRGHVRRSKPFERNAAKERMRRALQFAADPLNSFSVAPYEEPEPAPDAEGTPLRADAHADADKKKQQEMPAATAASGAGPPGRRGRRGRRERPIWRDFEPVGHIDRDGPTHASRRS